MKRVLGAGLLLLFSLHVVAQGGGLVELYRLALQNDPTYAAARATWGAGLESRNIGLAALLPTVQGSVGVWAVTKDWTIGNVYGEKNFRTRSNSISISQPLFDLEKFKDYSIGQMQASYAEAVFAAEGQSLVLRTSQAYFDFLLAQDNFELATAQKNALAAQSEQVYRLFESGISTVTDMEESKARHQVAAAQELSAANALEIARKQLEKIVGTIPHDLRHSGVYAFDPVVPEPNDVEAWKVSSRRGNLKVFGAGINLKLAELQAEKSQVRHLPVVQMTASYQHALDPSETTGRSNIGRVGVELVVPFFEGGRVSAESRRALLLQEKAAKDLEAELRQSEIESAQAFLGVVGGFFRIKAFEQAVKSSEVALQGMEVGQRYGMRTNTDVLTAQQQLYSVRRDLQRERYEYLISRLKLKAAAGSLNETDIAFVDQLVKLSKTPETATKNPGVGASDYGLADGKFR